jgi:hypothetical protein
MVVALNKGRRYLFVSKDELLVAVQECDATEA